MTSLTPLTSSKADYAPTEQHKQVFEELKQALIREPLHYVPHLGIFRKNVYLLMAQSIYFTVSF